MLYRRFGSVFSRLLLRKQDEMGRIEATLQGMDKTDEANEHVEYLMSHTLDRDRESTPNAWPESRTELMNKLEKKALDYGIEPQQNPEQNFCTKFSNSRAATQNPPAQIVKSAVRSRISKRLALHGE